LFPLNPPASAIMAVSPIPEGHHTVTPYLILAGAAEALDFYRRAFDAKELMRVAHGDKIGHAEIQIGDSRIMLGDEMPEMKVLGPKSLGGTSVGLCLYVEDVDSLFNQAVAAGMTVERPLANQFYGDRSATLVDPFGHKWTIATHIEDVSPEEIKARMASWKPE
jgi:PhnB protein